MVDLASGLVPDSILALHGVAAEGIVVGTGGGWADGLDEVSDISTFELAGASYTRLEGTFSVERIGDEWILFVEGFSAVDLSDSAARIGVWLATAGGDLVGFEADAGAPTGSYLPAWPDGAVVRPIEPVDLSGGGGSSWTMTTSDDIGVYSDGTVAILAAITGDPVAIDSPALLTTLPVGVRPQDAVTAICKWRNPIVDIGDPGDFGDALVAVQTTGEVQVMDHTGTLTGSDEVDPLIVGLTWLVAT